MAAYGRVVVVGNKAFGGYLSIDGDKSFFVEDLSVFELSPGPHLIQICSKPDMASGNGWNIRVEVEEDDGVDITVYSKDKDLIAAPAYEVYELNEETIRGLREHFEEIRIIENTPRRSTKMMAWGGILAGLGVVCIAVSATNGELSAILPGSLFFIAVGGLLLFFGSKKKVRK